MVLFKVIFQRYDHQQSHHSIHYEASYLHGFLCFLFEKIVSKFRFTLAASWNVFHLVFQVEGIGRPSSSHSIYCLRNGMWYLLYTKSWIINWSDYAEIGCLQSSPQARVILFFSAAVQYSFCWQAAKHKTAKLVNSHFQKFSNRWNHD